MEQLELGTKEFYEALEFFERIKSVRGNYEREEKELWKIGAIYKNGEVNTAFNYFLKGINYGILLCREGE